MTNPPKSPIRGGEWTAVSANTSRGVVGTGNDRGRGTLCFVQSTVRLCTCMYYEA